MAAQSALASFGTVPPSAPMVEPVDYVDPLDNHALQGFVSIPDITPAPAVVIIVSTFLWRFFVLIHELGLPFFDRNRYLTSSLTHSRSPIGPTWMSTKNFEPP